MKKLTAILFMFCLAVTIIPALTAYAEDSDSGDVKEPSNVTITVVIPDPEPAPVEEPTPTAPPTIKVYPSDVTDIRDGGGWQIVKTYSLLPDELPEDIPREPFERSGWTFTLTDIIRTETANAETREHIETVTLDTETKELETILPMLSPTMEYRDEDGFVGVLSLDVSSIKVETAGTRTSSYTMSVTREYPHLSSNDTSLVPKTVTDRGTTYTLAGVEWRAGNTVTVDYNALPEYYTAIASYTATGTSTRVTGYTTTAEYTGTLAKLSQGRTIYTAYFLGEEIRTPLEMVTPTPEPESTPTPTETPSPDTADGSDCEPTEGEESESDAAEGDTETEPDEVQEEPPEENGGDNKTKLAYLAIIPCIAALAGGAYYFIKKRKGNTRNEESNNAAPVADNNGGDGSPGSGG